MDGVSLSPTASGSGVAEGTALLALRTYRQAAKQVKIVQAGEQSLRQQRKETKDLKAERQRMADAAWDD